MRQKQTNKKLKILLAGIFLLLNIFLVVPKISFADNAIDSGSTICSPDNSQVGSGKNLSNCVNNIYSLSVALAATVSVVMLIIAGYLYMTGGDSVKKAKSYISAVVWGLLILFGTYALLNTINPDLTNINGVILPDVQCDTAHPCGTLIAQSGGGTGVNGTFIIDGFDLISYATSPNFQPAITRILGSLQGTDTSSAQAIDAYIQRVDPGSPITGAMVENTYNNYGTDVKMLLAIMQNDSQLGNAGKGSYTHNPGNVGNNDSGQTVDYGTWQDGVDAVANWLEGHRAN
jgi:type IV secretory pathway VirB2 component (pilin)